MVAQLNLNKGRFIQVQAERVHPYMSSYLFMLDSQRRRRADFVARTALMRINNEQSQTVKYMLLRYTEADLA